MKSRQVAETGTFLASLFFGVPVEVAMPSSFQLVIWIRLTCFTLCVLGTAMIAMKAYVRECVAMSLLRILSLASYGFFMYAWSDTVAPFH